MSKPLRVEAFFEAVSNLTYAEMVEVSSAVQRKLPLRGKPQPDHVAIALSAAATVFFNPAVVVSDMPFDGDPVVPVGGLGGDVEEAGR